MLCVRRMCSLAIALTYSNSTERPKVSALWRYLMFGTRPMATCNICKYRSVHPYIRVFVASRFTVLLQLGIYTLVFVRIWWQVSVAPCPCPPVPLKRMSWWVRIGGRCCRVLGSPDGLSSWAQRARYILEKWTFKVLWRATNSTVKCTRAKESPVFIRPGKAAGQSLIDVQLFPQTDCETV